MQDYFPLDVAFDDAFFDRDVERKRLQENMQSNTHTLITSPRRYGKTSLVFKVLGESTNMGSVQMDMMVASDAERMKSIILDGIGKAASMMASGKTKIIEVIKKIFQPFNTIESIEYGDLTVRFYPYSATKEPHLIVLDALQRLEKVAISVKMRVVLFFDEYQHVLGINGALEYEAALRAFAQTSKQVMCIFSGSNRHMLQAVFQDASRPFYNMCDHILLERISAEDYRFHLLRLSKKRWKHALPDDTIDLILEITACHSYYMNALCRRLWFAEKSPDNEAVMEAWKRLASEKRYEISNDLEKLSPIQRTILIELAREPFAQPTSKEVIKRINASLSGISNAMEGLLERDTIYQDVGGNYKILSPLMEYVLRQEILKLM